ncbi:AP2/ERF and B3 domain-containing protein Os01g0141000-like [Panicum virgatum]|uniref:AP2/ERF and B3 domain-containing protein n=1 Tax=Panicum virgatum TaxID=38727 RepID=A0A8T0TWA2_PANVG|nr:AP2/ERF and B3 domain-containing protein Os01g0141000-like [Panicum virgatum]KAG2616472.1 hypothetical protein PVAP13_3NG209555 [Panicum virgatum]
MSTSTQEAEQDWMAGDEAVASSPRARSSSSRYKGVVPQPNGRWGAQIYERHARVWLGTFADEAAAARAYDVAALRFRGRGAAVNSPGPADAAEMAFLAARPKAEVVDMLRKHTYDDELRQALRSGGAGGGGGDHALALVPRVPLFEKAVTPSDVGRLNRLVVPKLHAEKHFPPLDEGADAAPPVLLAFEDVDGGGKVWRFRYSFWSSSQSYVLTRGWSRFVREKGIIAGDTVAFSQAASADGEMDVKRRMFIECRKRKRKDGGGDDFCPGGGARVVRLFGANIAASAIGASCMC